MATEKSVYDTLRNNKYRSNLPEIFKQQYHYSQTERSKMFEFKDSLFENVSEKFDMDKLEDEQESIINKIEEFKNDTIQLYIQDNKVVNKSEIDKITSIPNELHIKFREYFGNKCINCCGVAELSLRSLVRTLYLTIMGWCVMI